MNDITKTTKSRWIVFALAVLMASTWVVDEAQATPMLRLFDGTTTQTITDNGVGDLSSDLGVILFNGAIGNFSLNVTTGVTKPFVGSANAPLLDLVSVDVTGKSGGTLKISFTETDFTLLDPTAFESSIGGTSNTGTLMYSSFLDSSNTAFGEATSLGSQTFGPGPFSGAFLSSTLPSTSPYSLTQVATLTMPSYEIMSFDAQLKAQVPEPRALILMGFGLIGLAVWGKYNMPRKQKV